MARSSSKSSAWCWAAKISWVVTAIVSIDMALLAFFQFSLFQMNFIMQNPSLAQLLVAFIGLCGLYSFVTFVMHCSGDCK